MVRGRGGEDWGGGFRKHSVEASDPATLQRYMGYMHSKNLLIIVGGEDTVTEEQG